MVQSEKLINMVIDTKDMAAARIPVIVLGAGTVGLPLLKRFQENHKRYGVYLISDSKNLIFNEDGFSAKDLEKIIAAKTNKKELPLPDGALKRDYGLEDIKRFLDTWGKYFLNKGTPQIMADVSPSSDNLVLAKTVLETGGHVVFANKNHLAGSLRQFRELTKTGRVHYEATVGADLPTIHEYGNIIRDGHTDIRLEAAASGSLGKLLSGLEENLFSEILWQLTPDLETKPMIDLSGRDVLNKGMISSWKLGFPHETDNGYVNLKSFIGDALEHYNTNNPCDPLDVNLLSGAVKERERDGGMVFREIIGDKLDEYYKNLFQNVLERGKTLRYLMTVSKNGIEVGPKEVSVDSDFGRLRGSDNLFIITSKINGGQPYKRIIGPGAGSGDEVTAKAVFADIWTAADIIQNQGGYSL